MGFSLQLGSSSRRPEDRHRMIKTHNAFLNWALAQDRQLPRIPTRRVDQGGFTALMSRPAAR